jgi:hypothetical protein
MVLENIISKFNQAQKTKGCMFSLIMSNINPKQMQAILQKTIHTKVWSHTREEG